MKKVLCLLLAGRCVSADSTAAGAIRVMPPCMGMGQAAGTAAAMAAAAGCAAAKIDVRALQRTLLSRGVTAPGSMPQ